MAGVPHHNHTRALFMNHGTNVKEFIETLNGGIFNRQLSIGLSEVAAALVEHGGKGELTISIKMEQVGNTKQIKLPTTLKYTRPTSSGKRIEDFESVSLMYLGMSGLVPFREEQEQMFTADGKVVDRYRKPYDRTVEDHPRSPEEGK